MDRFFSWADRRIVFVKKKKIFSALWRSKASKRKLTAQKHASTEPGILTQRWFHPGFLSTEEAAGFASVSWRHRTQAASCLLPGRCPGSPHRVAASWSPAGWASPGQLLGQSHNPGGHSAWQWRLPFPASHHLQDSFTPPVSKLGLWLDLVPVPGLGRSSTPCDGGLSPQDLFFFFPETSLSGNQVLTSLRHRGTGTEGPAPDTALTVGLTPLSLRDGPASFLWRDHNAGSWKTRKGKASENRTKEGRRTRVRTSGRTNSTPGSSSLHRAGPGGRKKHKRGAREPGLSLLLVSLGLHALLIFTWFLVNSKKL